MVSHLIINVWKTTFSNIMFYHLIISSSLVNFLTYPCLFRIISILSVKKTLWKSLVYENIQKNRKPPKLILVCMTRSKSVQIAWILVILINLTHFFIDLLEIFFLLSRKPFQYRSLFKNKKHMKKAKNGSHWFLLATGLLRSWICLIFAENFGISWYLSSLRDIFLLFRKIIHNRLALYFWSNHTIFMKKVGFF